MPFLVAMMFYNRLEHEEQLSVKYFALFAHFHHQKYNFIRHIFLESQNSGDVYELITYILYLVVCVTRSAVTHLTPKQH